MADFPSRAIIKRLNVYLKLNMASLLKAYDDFPAPNQTLTMPCLSVFAKTPDYTPGIPYVKSKGAEITTGADTGKFPIFRVMGKFEFQLQIDLWCSSKPERALLETQLLKAFSNNPSVPGISLQLTDYFNEWARFDIIKFAYPDNEASSQRGEWRTMIDVLASVRHIHESNEYLIETIENTLETPDSISSEDAESVTTII